MATGPTVLASAAMAQPASTSTVGTLAAQPPPAVHPLGTADFRSGGTAVAAAAGFALALPSVVAPSVLAPSTSAAVAPVDAVGTGATLAAPVAAAPTVSALALADSVALAGSATALPPHRQAQAQAAANASVLRRGSRPSAATSAAGLPHLPAPAIAAGGAAARALQQVQAVGFPADALQWLRDIQFPLVNGASTIDVLPARVGEQLGSCYALCRVLQAGAAAPDSFGLGRKLSALLPRLLLGPHGRTREAASRAVRRRCLLFCECSWAQLWPRKPVPRLSFASGGV
jgi:hypothetical protein